MFRCCFLSLVLLAFLAAQCCAAEIEAPDRVAPCSGLVRVTGKPTSGGRLAWLIIKPFGLDTEKLATGEGFVFAAPAKPTEIHLALVEVTPDNVEITQRLITVANEPDEPTDPDDPDTGGIPAVLASLGAILNEVPEAYRGYGKAIADNCDRIAADIRAGRFDSVKTASVKHREYNRNSLPVGPARDSWVVAFDKLAKLMSQSLGRDFFDNQENYARVCEAVARGIRSTLR